MNKQTMSQNANTWNRALKKYLSYFESQSKYYCIYFKSNFAFYISMIFTNRKTAHKGILPNKNINKIHK